MLLLVEHNIAYAITADEFAILVADRAKGEVHPLDHYGFEAGTVLGDVTEFSQAAATVLHAAMSAGNSRAADMSPALAIRLAEVSSLIDEHSMFFATDAEQAA